MTRATLSIVSHGHHRHVAALLHDLARQTIADEVEVVLTLNIPEPDPDLAAVAPLRVRIVRNDTPKGFGANHNAALRNVTTPWVVVVNPDIRVDDPTLLARLIEGHEERALGVVAPVIRNSRGDLEDSIRRNLDPVSLFKRAILRDRSPVDPTAFLDGFHWVAGMFMALPLAAWRSVDGFDERFFLYCEDYDLCARLVGTGRHIEVDKTLVAIHDAQRSSRTSDTYLRWHVASLFRVWTSAPFWRIWTAELTGTSLPSGRDCST